MRVRLALAAALFAAPQVAAAQAKYDDAVAARRAGNTAKAAALLSEIVRSSPDNADAQVQYGYALLALGRLAEARTAFNEALRVSPSYEDARVGLALAAERSGDVAEARRQLSRVSVGNADAGPLRERLARTTARYQVDMDGSVSLLNRGQPDWKDGAIQLRVPAGKNWMTARVEASRRFNRDDFYGEIRLDSRLSPDTGFYLFAGGTPHADFRPKMQLGAGGDIKLSTSPNPTVATADISWSRYRSGTVWTVNPGLQQYLGGGRFWVTARWINTFSGGQHSSGWLARADIQTTERLRLYAGAANAPDTSEGIVLDTFSLFSGLSYDVSERQTVRLSLARDNRDGGSDRTQIGIGTGIRF